MYCNVYAMSQGVNRLVCGRLGDEGVHSGALYEAAAHSAEAHVTDGPEI
jgi:hypothetical protein